MAENKFVAIGDVHGCLKSLNALLDALDNVQDRTLVFVGDYIDRGPKSMQVVERLITLSETQSCIFLRGNHEQMLLDAYFEGQKNNWFRNGGKVTIQSYGCAPNRLEFPQSHLSFYKNTRMYFDTENYFFVHAGLSPSKTIRECLDDDDHQGFLWERSHLNAFETPWEKTVVFGHTPRPHPIRKSNMLGIDTGCVYDSLGYGKLTAVLLPETEFVQQKCLDN